MNFSYISSGAFSLGGCSSPIVLTQNFYIKFAVGSMVYIKAKAEIGKLEKIIIKKVNRNTLNNTQYSGVSPTIVYIDSLNGAWLENELCWEAMALSLSIDYYEELAQYNTNLVMQCK